MKKYKLLYFVSEDEYFISHKIDQAISGFKVFNEITIISRFSKYSNKIKSSGFRTKNIKLNILVDIQKTTTIFLTTIITIIAEINSILIGRRNNQVIKANGHGA